MRIRKFLLAGSLVAGLGGLAGVPMAQADPLTPPSPIEMEFLGQVHRVFAVHRDQMAFKGDGELLDAGRYVCHQRARGIVGHEATLVSPVVTQLAFIYLCPA